MYLNSNFKPFAFSSPSINFNEQNFSEIKQNCLKSAKKFIDKKFPTSKITKNATWLRPGEIVEKPKLFVNGCSRFDSNQGKSFGDCWVIAVMANLAMHPNLLNQVVCIDNSDFDNKNYAGIFHFRFWHNAHWVDIVIDDLLPTQNAELMFVRSTEKNEFWSALLEKAYAKLNVGYDNIIGGFCNNAFSNFTGGVTETYDLSKPHPDLFNMMKKSFERNTLMNVGLLDPSKERLGLFAPHAYSVTKVVTIKTKDDQKVQLVRIRNPWGNHIEWRGAWSDKSNKWKNVSNSEKARIKFKDNADGEFYMSFKDFLKCFDEIEICNLTPDLLNCTPRSDREWKMMSLIGNFNYDSHNFKLFDPDEDDDEDFCTIVISVCQFQGHRDDEIKEITIEIYSEDETLILTESFKNNSREFVHRTNLKPGNYVILVNGTKELKYLLRIFYEVKTNFNSSESVISEFFDSNGIAVVVGKIPEIKPNAPVYSSIECNNECYVTVENEKINDRVVLSNHNAIGKLPKVPKYPERLKMCQVKRRTSFCEKVLKTLACFWFILVIFGFLIVAMMIYDEFSKYTYKN